MQKKKRKKAFYYQYDTHKDNETHLPPYTTLILPFCTIISNIYSLGHFSISACKGSVLWCAERTVCQAPARQKNQLAPSQGREKKNQLYFVIIHFSSITLK